VSTVFSRTFSKNSYKTPSFIIGVGAILFCTALGIEWMSPLLILFSGALLGGLFIAIFVREEERRFVFEILLTALLARILFIIPFFILSYAGVAGRPGFYFMNDGYAYSANGWQISELWRNGLPLDSSILFVTQTNTPPGPFDFWNAFIYFWGGNNPLCLFFINACIGVGSALFVYLFTRKFYGYHAARFAICLSAFWPSLMFWSTQNLRDPAINMSIFLFVWSAIELRRRFNPGFLIMALSSSFVVMQFRFQVLPILVAVTFLWIFSETLLWRKMKLLSLVFLVLLIFIVAPYVLALKDLFNEKMALVSIRLFQIPEVSLLRWVHYLRDVRAEGTSAFLTNIQLLDIGDVVLFLPLLILYVLFAPFPWTGGGTFFLMGAIEMSFLYLTVPFIISGCRKALKVERSSTKFTLLLFFSVSLALAVIDSNLGILFRHRSMVLYFILIFLSIGLVRSKEAEVSA